MTTIDQDSTSTEERSIESQSSDVAPHISRVGRSLKSIPPGEFDILTADYSFNHIKFLPPYVFFTRGYRHLYKIELYHNQITNISKNAFKELNSLQILDLSENNITSLDTNTLKTNIMLEKLDLTSNRISFDPLEPFLHCKSLETLILTDNRIGQIFEITFYKLPKLRNLILDKNLVFSIEIESFSPIRHLQYLSLAHTTVDKLSVNMFRNNETLPSVLDVTDTPLGSRFSPPLKKVKYEGVWKLINIDNLF